VFEGRKIAAVIPAYNESRHIGEVIRRMPDYVDAIIVVDDNSSDGTASVAEGIGDPRVHVIRHTRQSGVGGATISGFRRALEYGADVAVKIDGDGQMDPARLPELITPIVREGCDYAKGNRFLDTDALGQMPLPRLLGSFALTFLTKLASGHWNVFDPQNGYVAVSARALAKIDLDEIATDFFFENDMLVHLNILNLRVKDVPIPAIYGSEQSKLRIRRILLGFPPRLAHRLMIRIWRKYVLRDFSPIAVFWLLGIPLLVFGGVFGLTTWVNSWWSGVPASTGTVMLSVLPFLLGFELMLQAIILEIQETRR
jgi:glycosyltransferase involved in cell wall biosynthesis